MAERPSFSISEAAEACDLSRSTIRRDLDDGKYPNAFQDDEGWWRIPVEDLIAAGRQPQAPAGPDEGQPAASDRLREVEEERDTWRRRAEVAETRAETLDRLATSLEQALKALPAGTRSEPLSADLPAGEGVDTGDEGLWGRPVLLATYAAVLAAAIMLGVLWAIGSL